MRRSQGLARRARRGRRRGRDRARRRRRGGARAAAGARRPRRAPTGRPLRRRARVRRAASARSSWARGPPARRRCASSPGGCAARSRAGASSRSPGTRGCATSSGTCRARSRRSRSPRTTTPRTCRASSAPTTARAGRRPCSSWRARSRQADRPTGAPALRFLLFDGEEATDDSRAFERTGLRGSKAYARAPRRRAARADPARLRGRQATCGSARGLVGPAAVGASCARAATTVGARAALPAGDAARAITDDHTPFLRAGVPVDRPDPVAVRLLARALRRPDARCSERSLDASGETVLELVRTLSGYVTAPEKLLLAAPRGYCAGVDRAVQTVERALDLHGAAGLRAQGDRPQQARGRGARRARRDLRRRARATRSPRAR